jgi:hypothetical protein
MDSAGSRTFPTNSQPELYKVPADGGRVEQVLTTPAEDVKLSKNGQYLIYQDKKGGENAWRKHHTSSIARDIWICDSKAGTHKKVTSFPGEDRNPIFTDNDKAFYYLSEESGSFNIHKMRVEGGKSQQITFFKKLPVRFLSLAANDTLCFSYDGEIYSQKGNGKPQKVNVTITADVKSNNEKIVPVNGGAREMAVSPSGKEVDRLSSGQLRYIHVPGMSDSAYRTTYEEVMGKYANRQGIVVDTRFNGGGDLVADLAMFLSGKKFFDYTTDTRSNGYEPNFRWTKPSISLANEANYSDGHCYAFTYKNLNLGKLVGMPVPGTCTFAGWEALQDNSIRWGVPPLGVKTMNGAYLENHQTEPDIKLMNEYEVVSKGRDQQLEAAVAALLKEIK